MSKLLLDTLENAWEDGFFYSLRNGIFDEFEYAKLKEVFESIRETKVDFSNKRIIELLWFIPLFIIWQEERLCLNGLSKDKFNEIFNFFYNECEILLGLP